MRAPDLYHLELAESNGLVRRQSHPTLPLLIWNYTETCAFSGAWDATTLQTRGLITDLDGNVVARPFLKFFNLGEPACPVTDITKVRGPLEITDKLDGSLGIIYPTDDGFAVATRGSFTSEQALHATAILRGKYGSWSPPEGVTVLVEIIYPENRIVLDYGRTDDLFLLGAVINETGADALESAVAWPGPVRDTFVMSLNALLAETKAPTMSDNREGFVLAWPRNDGPAVRVKIKYAEYVALHRVVTGLSTKVVHEFMAAGKLDDLLAIVPSEWQGVLVAYSGELLAEYTALLDRAQAAVKTVDGLSSRKEQAAVLLNEHREVASFAFALLDGRDIAPGIWRAIEPTWRPLTPTESGTSVTIR